MEFNDDFQTDTKNEIFSENFAKGTNSAHLVRIWELRSIFTKILRGIFFPTLSALPLREQKLRQSNWTDLLSNETEIGKKEEVLQLTNWKEICSSELNCQCDSLETYP